MVRGMDQLWQGMGPRALQKQVSVSSRLCPFFPSLPLSFCYLHCWRHTLHIETTLGKFCHIVLSQPRRNWLSCGHPPSICSWISRSLWAVGLRAPPSPTASPVFWVSGGPIGLSPTESFALLNSALRSQDHVLRWGVVRHRGLQWPSVGSVGRRTRQTCARGSPVTPGCRMSAMG